MGGSELRCVAVFAMQWASSEFGSAGEVGMVCVILAACRVDGLTTYHVNHTRIRSLAFDQ